MLIYVSSVLRCLLQEPLVRDEIKVRLIRLGIGVFEGCLVDEVTSELLVDVPGKAARRSEGFDAVTVGALGVVQVLFINSLLVTWTAGRGDTRLAGIDEDGVIGGLFVEANLELLVVTGIRSNLGCVQRMNVTDNTISSQKTCKTRYERCNSRIRGLGREVHVVDAQLVVEPVGLALDKFRRNEALFLHFVHDPRGDIRGEACIYSLPMLTLPIVGLCPRI